MEPAWHDRCWTRLALPALAGVLAVLTACTKVEALKENPPGGADSPSTLVQVESLQRGEIEDVLERTAEIEAQFEVPLMMRVGGMVQSVFVDVGDHVEAGQLLLKVEDVEFALEASRMAASLQDAKEARTLSEIALEEAVDQEATAILRREQAQREYERTLQLSESHIASKSELEAKKLAQDDAEAQERAAVFRKRRAEVDRAQAENAVKLAEIAEQNAKLQLGYTQLVAPFEGAISFRNVDSGGVVAPNSHVLTLVDDQNLVIDVKITQKDLLRVQIGQSVEITAREALPDLTFHGRIERINPVVDVTSGSLVTQVRILDTIGTPLRPGLFVECRILTHVSSNSLLVPRRAVFWQDKKSAFFLVEDGVVHKIEFEAGPGTGPYAQIVHSSRPDLESGMSVVVVGKDRLEDGGTVRISRDSSAELGRDS